MATYENWLNRRKGKYEHDVKYKLDRNNTPEENLIDMLQWLYIKKPILNDLSPTNMTIPPELRPLLGTKITVAQFKIAYDKYRKSILEAIVTLLTNNRNNLGFTIDELITCIRVSLVDECMTVREAALRTLRYLIQTESDVATFNTLNLPYLVIRSMDVLLRNEDERAQALRVVRRVIGIVGTEQPSRRYRAAYLDQGLVRCLVAIARANSAPDGSSDRLARPAIATLAELCVLNPDLFISCGGVSAVTRQLAECATPRMAEALCGVLLHTLNESSYRYAARIDLTCLSSPYSDFHFRPVGTASNRDEREMRFTCSRLSLLCMLRSWPGLLHFCGPRAGGLRALVASLYLPRLEVRQAILDLLYELVGLPQPEWTDEISVALDAVDPSDFQDSWRLNEGFVAAEGTAILPHLSITGPDITEIHLALLLQCFLEAGLLDSLAEVIVTSDTFISVRATVLLGQLLHLIHLLLPAQIFSVTPALPSLMSQAAAGKPQALAAVAALRRLHAMLEARPASYSLFLDHIIQYCSGAFKEKVEDTKSRKEKSNASMVKPKPVPEPAIYKDNSIEFLNESDNENEPKQRHSVGSRADVANRNVSALVKSKSVSSRTSAAVSKVTKAKFFNLFERDSDNLIRSSLVMQNKDGNTWDWEIIRTILKENDSTPLLNLNDSGHKAWVARIINYLKPSSNKYSHSDLTNTGHGHFATRAGCQLIRHLLRHNDADSQRLLEDFFSDVSRQIEAIQTGLKAHECLFSPQHMCNTMCQMYFLFVGQLCHTHTGLRLFKHTHLYENLLELSTKTHHSCYVKLVISSLDYTLDSYPRDILAKTLTCNIQASRLYATQFLNVLLRASQKSRELVRRKTKLKRNFMQEHYKSSHKEDGDVTNGTDMDTWILQMLVGQVKDECKEVVQSALTSLEEAHSVPAYLDKLMSLKDTLGQNCKLDKASDPSSLDFSVAGDRGYILWLSLEVNASVHSSDAKTTNFLKKHLDYWTKFYNYRYVGLVECGVHEALAVAAEGRTAVRARRPARLPVHIHAALASAPAPASTSAPRPRAVLHQVLPEHYKILQRKKCTTEQEISDLKASLWALGNTAVTPQGLQLISQSNGYLEESVPGHIVRLAKSSPVYSVRATAFYVLGLIGSTYDGANLLAGLGWLSVRRTRLDQFPIIQSEIYPQDYDTNLSCLITSPDRRYNALDQEVSELSDHTDQSTVESLHSDHNKHSNKAMATIEHSEKEQDVVNDKIGFIKEPDKRKSHTLPTQGYSSHDRPTLSESKTVDILRDCSNYERPGTNRPVENRLLIGRMNSLDHAHEGRMRNTSESSTSGVSSCDSFLAKYAIPDRVLTLSPIPSSSSLHGMKSSSSSQKPRLSETQRRTSTSSFSAQEVGSSPPPQMDMVGYTTWTTLNRHRRPHLSESAASGSSDIDDLSWLLSDSNRRTKPFSSLRDRTKHTRERMSKQSLLDYDWMPLQLGETSRAPLTPPPAPTPAPARLTCHPPPAYIGICLPRDINELFPKDETSEDGNTNDEEKPEVVSGRERVPSYLADSSNASTENKSRATPDSHVASHREATTSVTALSTISAGVSTGNAVSEAASKTTVTITTEAQTEDKTTTVSKTKVISTVTNTNVTNTVTNCTSSVASVEVTSSAISVTVISSNTSTVSNTVRATGITRANSIAAVTSTTTSTGGSIPNTGINKEPSESNINNPVEGNRKWRHVAADCVACVRTRPPSAHELREAFFADMDGPSRSRGDTRGATNVTELDPSSPRAEILRQVHLMSNPIYSKQTRSTLLSLKQRHPELFRSPCVYSDVSALMSRHTYMLVARRFIQELFLDVNFESFQGETAAIIPPIRQ